MPARADLTVDRLARVAVHVALVAAALFFGGRPPAVVGALQALVVVALFCWVASMTRDGTIEWRPTSADLPFALLIALVAIQLVVGNGSLAAWALGAPDTRAIGGEVVPTPVFVLGTIAPGATWQALLGFLTYIAVYLLVVHLFRRRRHIEALIRTLLITATVLALAGLAEYFAQEAGLFPWRELERRVTATFTNADHFGAWLNMITLLGLGQFLTSGGRSGRRALTGLPLKERCDELARRHARLVVLVVLVLATVFTLSRGAILSLIAGLIAMVVLATAIGRARRVLAAVGILLCIALAYGTWLGLEPLFARFRYGNLGVRWEIVLATLPMIRDFPVLGLGLGAYQEISARYQTAALDPGLVLINHAHNDWLQLLVELGPAGAVLGLYAIVRVARDLVGAHLVGRGPCPVGGGEHEYARRNDPFSVGVALGAIAGLVSLMVHSVVDFSVRGASVGMLAAGVLGIATVTLHTRFGTTDGWLSARRSFSLSRRQARLTTAGALGVAAVLVLIVIRPAIADVLVTMARRQANPAFADAAGVIDASVRTLIARADARYDRASRLFVAGALTASQPVAPLADRQREAAALLYTAVELLRHGAAGHPSSPIVHDRLGSAYLLLGGVEPSHADAHVGRALAHMQRAVALDPQNPLRYEKLARLVVGAYPAVPIDVGLRAAREAIARKPELAPELVYLFLITPLTEPQWRALAPDTVSARVALADLLEQHGLKRESIGLYRGAVEIASPRDASVASWLLARALMRQRDAHGALRELGAAARVDPDNPEIHLTTADALQMTADAAAALTMYRAALSISEDRLRRSVMPETPFRIHLQPIGDVAARQLGPAYSPPTLRYRRRLALHLAERELWLQAMKEADAVLADAPKDAVGHFARGLALEGLGQTDAAVEALRAAVSVDGGNVQYRLRLARTLRNTKQPNQALNEWRAVLDHAPTNLEAALALARTYDQLGAKSDAMSAYERVYRLAPDNVEARRALARFGWIER